MKPVIGILGGMGPRATVVFEQLLLDCLPGNDQALPTIVTINDGSIPDRSRFLKGRGPDPVPRLRRNLRHLESLGATVVCLPCNTACAPAIFDRLQPDSCTLLNLPQLVGDQLIRDAVGRIFLLATEGTIESGSYQSVCEAAGIDYTAPDRQVQQLVSAVIRAVKRGDMGLARRLSLEVKTAVASSNCDAVLLGCTELPLVSRSLVPANCRPVDSLTVLAEACASYTRERGIRK